MVWNASGMYLLAERSKPIKKPSSQAEYSWDESRISVARKLPWYHPDCRHPHLCCFLTSL